MPSGTSRGDDRGSVWANDMPNEVVEKDDEEEIAEGSTSFDVEDVGADTDPDSGANGFAHKVQPLADPEVNEW